MAPTDPKGAGDSGTNPEDDKWDIKESYNLPEYLEMFKNFDWSLSYSNLGMNEDMIKFFKHH